MAEWRRYSIHLMISENHCQREKAMKYKIVRTEKADKQIYAIVDGRQEYKNLL